MLWVVHSVGSICWHWQIPKHQIEVKPNKTRALAASHTNSRLLGFQDGRNQDMSRHGNSSSSSNCALRSATKSPTGTYRLSMFMDFIIGSFSKEAKVWYPHGIRSLFWSSTSIASARKIFRGIEDRGGPISLPGLQMPSVRSSHQDLTSHSRFSWGQWTSIVVSGPSHPEWKLASRHGLGYLVGKSHIFSDDMWRPITTKS